MAIFGIIHFRMRSETLNFSILQDYCKKLFWFCTFSSKTDPTRSVTVFMGHSHLKHGCKPCWIEQVTDDLSVLQ